MWKEWYLFVISFFHRDNRRIGNQRKVNSGIRHQVRLELIQIHVEGTVKSQRGRDGGDNLPNQTIEISISWPLNVKVASANIVNGFIVHHESTIGMVQSSVGGQD